MDQPGEPEAYRDAGGVTETLGGLDTSGPVLVDFNSDLQGAALAPAAPSSTTRPALRDVIICALAYTIATLFVFTPLSGLFGNTGSKHTIATVSVWFHPVRPLGNLLEVLYYTGKLLALGCLISLGATLTADIAHSLSAPVWGNLALLIVWIGGGLGLIGVLKIRANNASFNTASSAGIIFLVSVLVKEDDTQHGSIPVDLILQYFSMVVCGAAISSIVSILLYRRTSLAAIGKRSSELRNVHAAILELLINQYGSTTKADSPALEETLKTASALLSALKQQLGFALYEAAIRQPFAPRTYPRYASASADVASLQRQSMHLGGIVHCVGVKNRLIPSTRAQDVVSKLMPPIKTFASWLAAYMRSDPRADRTSVSAALVQYTHARDKALLAIVPNATAPADEDSLQATTNLFAHMLQDLGEEVLELSTTEWRASPEPEAEPFSELTAALYPTRKNADRGIGPKLWRLLRNLRNRDIQHGIRVGLGAVVISFPAFVPELRPTFNKWHGEWAIITYMIIMARNLGAMTHNIPLRIGGTIIGALIAIVAQFLCEGSAIPLIICSALVAVGCYYRILSQKDPVFGRFILLAYNLVCLYSFSVTHDGHDDDDLDFMEPIYDVAFHRVVSVCIGVLWAVFVTVTILPYSARRALRSELCIQWMRMGMTWKSDPIGIAGGSASVSGPYFKGIFSERVLQNTMLDLDTLLSSSPNEFRLRGKFDPGPYRILINSTQVILDAFHSLSVLIDDAPEATPGELELVNLTGPDRRELSNLLFLQFYTAATSVRLGFPVPEYMPSPARAVTKLLTKLKDKRAKTALSSPRDVAHHSTGAVSREFYDFELFYTYLMVVISLTAELRQIHDALRSLFGTLDDELLFAYV